MTPLARFIRRVVGDFRFERPYPATVERDNGDGTVDVSVEDEELRGSGLQSVRVRSGLAASSGGEIAQGTRCLLGFISADPERPFVSHWEFKLNSAVVHIDGGNAGIVRSGDLFDVMISAAPAVSGVASGEITIPGSPPTIVPFADLPVIGVLGIATPVRARAVAGAQKVFA